MKRKTLTQSLSWLHTWGGLVFGWLLFAIFLTGTLAVFDKEIDGWMRPELPTRLVDQAEAAQRALDYLAARHPEAGAWNIGLPTERSPNLSVSAGEQRRGGGQPLDPHTGEPLQVRETAGGGFFFRFHFTLHMPRNIGIWIVGLAAMAMLVALISGIVIHKKIFKEFFTFRPAKGQRSWLDAHNATGVLLVPFHLMITYTGLVIFYLVYMPAAMDALFEGDREALFRELRGAPVEQRAERAGEHAGAQHASAERPAGRGERTGDERARPTGEPVPLTALGLLLAEAERVIGPVAGLSIRNPGRHDARIEARPVLGNRIELTKGQSMQFDGVTGAVLRMPAQSGPSQLTQRVMAGLHFAQFGGYPMRWLYFLCSLVSCAMIATGLVLFTVKRRRRHESEGIFGALLYRVVERLNVSVVAGLAVACVALLWANRLLPVELAQRGDWEVRVFFLVWLATLGHAIVRPWLQAWREQLGLAAALCIGLPLLNLAGPVRGNHLWLEASVVALGALLAWTCWKVGQPRQARPARSSTNPVAEAR
ncbi:PepSY domain-containing protein [Stutzerimonas nosocomialis]|uniref:PepSY-associated TM helix domain-containing protein n=1 Tax=Stutzerimonas nosocomialis TaxID=1056496 RepID=UPI001108D217|nr:PepSY-associated TM helix domain-containing protein [Stutzerimonas nosocomialis]TLX56184.1 PepSY domain-containing protein [Stutzerimonas nosocomialis]